jgi:DedD protein
LNQNTRQRLIGTLVLAVAALILLPVIFDGEGSYQPVLNTDIPSRPTRPEPARTDPQRPIITADTDAILVDEFRDTSAVQSAADAGADAIEPPVVAGGQDREVLPDTSSATTDAVSTTQTSPTLDAQGLPQGFSVRLASFGNATNASNLVARLQDAGHRAYSRRIESSQGLLTAVYVGPVIDRGAATALLEALREDFELNGLVVRYEIEEL